MTLQSPTVRRGTFLEDLEPGATDRSRIGRTITEVDDVWFTCLTMNTNQTQFNAEFASGTRVDAALVKRRAD